MRRSRAPSSLNKTQKSTQIKSQSAISSAIAPIDASSNEKKNDETKAVAAAKPRQKFCGLSSTFEKPAVAPEPSPLVFTCFWCKLSTKKVFLFLFDSFSLFFSLSFIVTSLSAFSHCTACVRNRLTEHCICFQHKTMDDGILLIKGSTCTLHDMEGKVIAKTNSYSKKVLADLKEVFSL